MPNKHSGAITLQILDWLVEGFIETHPHPHCRAAEPPFEL
jgi:hypothetical protein